MSSISKLEGMKIDEVSLVRRPANQHAAIVFSKADEGDDMPTIYTDTGDEVSIDDLEIGTLVEGENGEMWEVVEDTSDEADVEDAEEREPALVGKSDDEGEDYADLIAKAYSDAVSDEDKARLIASVAKQVEVAKSDARRAADQISKMEAEAYVEECISKAQEYGIAGPRTEEFGVAISKMLTVLDDSEIQLMDDIFKAFSELAVEVAKGSEAFGESDVLDSIESHATEIVKSSNGEISVEDAIIKAFEADPELYAAYLDEKKGIL